MIKFAGDESLSTGAQLRIFATVISTLICFTAEAADIGLRKSILPTQDPSASAKGNWTGAYLGVNGGWGDGAVRDSSDESDATSIKMRGSLGGMQVGYNHQIGDYVIGVEGDFALAKVKGALHANGQIDQFAVAGSVEGALQTFGSLRARAGLTMNSALFFATAGYAFGLVKITGAATVVDSSNGRTGSAALSDSQWANGWTIGGGVEYAFTPKITGKVEYLYADLGKTIPFKGGLGETPIWTKLNLFRAGVNYRF